MKDILWGIDLGGTKVEGIVLRDGEKPETLVRTIQKVADGEGVIPSDLLGHLLGQVLASPQRRDVTDAGARSITTMPRAVRARAVEMVDGPQQGPVIEARSSRGHRRLGLRNSLSSGR